MAGVARTILTAALLLPSMIVPKCNYSAAASTEATLLRVSKGIRVSAGYMELVDEARCSNETVRLTCRSLRAFVFVYLAEYRTDRTDICGHAPPNRTDKKAAPLDIRASFNRRCSGQHHCRYDLTTEYPVAKHWKPAALRFKYACIPDAAVRKYCNLEVRVPKGEGGFLKSPGYPLYYPGGNTCGWIFRTRPGQRIVLTFYDLSIRGPEPDGRCIDVIRIRESGATLFEYCGTTAGIELLSAGNSITLDLVATANLYPARGFFLRYQALDCPNATSAIPTANYSRTRTFLCKEGNDDISPDSDNRQRTIVECKNGKWNETVAALPGCVATSAVILKSENEESRLSSLSADNVLGGTGLRIGRGEDAVAVAAAAAAAAGAAAGAATPTSNVVMDSAQTSSMKQADYVVDVVLPTVLIALLFVGNAIIVYIIFQYRKRKEPLSVQTEEMSVLRDREEIPRV